MKRLVGSVLIVVMLLGACAFLTQGPSAFMRAVAAPKDGSKRKPTMVEMKRAQETWKARKLEK